MLLSSLRIILFIVNVTFINSCILIVLGMNRDERLGTGDGSFNLDQIISHFLSPITYLFLEERQK